MNNKYELGVLKTYDPIKGFGFIQRETGKDVFVRYADFTSKDADASALVGSVLQFEIENNLRGLRAKNVQIVS